MKFNPNIHHRHSIRLKGYDYSKEGAYFVTLCTYGRECLFGEIVNGSMIMNKNGIIVKDTYIDLSNHNLNIELDAFIIMPNHVHAIINVGAGLEPAPDLQRSLDTNYRADLKYRAGLEPAPTEIKPLSEIVRQLKTFSAMKINKLRDSPGSPIWQRNYYEHIIRNQFELNKAREYINLNPLKWEMDKENPNN